MYDRSDNVPTMKSIKLKYYTLVFILLWTLVIALLLITEVNVDKHLTRNIAVNEARAYFNKDNALRLWVTSHGGVYVPIDEKTPPNENLAQITERDIETPSGVKLTLMNPAYVIRQLNENFSEIYGVKSHITSLKPIRAANAPDDWERAALESFESGIEELSEFTEINGEPYLRLMQPMITKKECLKCHAQQGYKEGDIRGGISITLPMASLIAHDRGEFLVRAIAFSILWILGTGGIALTFRRLSNSVSKQTVAAIALADSESRWKALTEHSPDHIMLVDSKTNILYINHTIAGLTVNQVIGKSVIDTIPEEYKETVSECFARVMKTGKPDQYDTNYTMPDGTKHYFSSRVGPVWHNGEVVNMIVNSHDVTAQTKNERALRLIHQGTAGNLSEEFFNSLVKQLADVLEVQYAVIGELTGENQIKTLAIWDGSKLAENFSYDLDGTPCENVVCKTTCKHSANVQQQFPNDITLAEMSIESYIGTPLRDKNNNVSGILFVMDTQPYMETDYAGNILEIFAFRAAAELDRKKAEMAVNDSEKRYRAIAEDAPIMICRYLPGGEVTYVNNTYCRYFQKTSDELIGQNFLDLFPESDQITIKADIAALTVDASTQSHEHRVIGPNGEIRWQRWTNRAIFNDQGQTVSFQSVGEDITDRKQAEMALNQYEHIVSNTTDLLALIDKNFVYLAANAAYLREFNQKSEDLIGHQVKEIFSNEFFEKTIKPRADRCMAGEEVHYHDWLEFPISGRQFMDIAYSPYVNTAGEILGFVVSARNITEYKIAEQALKESETKLIEAQQVAKLGHYTINIKTGIWTSSPGLNEIFGIDDNCRKDIDKWLQIVHPDHRKTISCYLENDVLKQYKKFDKEYKIVDLHNKMEKWVHGLGNLRFNHDNKPIEIFGTIQDITERKLAETALRENEIRLRYIIESSTNLFYSHTPDDVITYLSPQAINVLDCKPEEALIHWTEFVTDNPINEIGYQLTQKAIETGKQQEPYELELITRTGRIVWVEVREAPVVENGITVAIVGSLTDITERKKTEDELHKSVTQLELLSIRLERLLKVSSDVQAAENEDIALQLLADAIQNSGWATVTAYSFVGWEKVHSAFAGFSGNTMEFSKTKQITSSMSKQMYSWKCQPFRISRSYYIPARDVYQLFQEFLTLPDAKQKLQQQDDAWNPNDLIYIPLYTSEGTIIGTVTLDNPEGGLKPTEDQFRYLESFADLGARAIENLRLNFDRKIAEQQQLAHMQYLQKMQRIDTVIRKSTELEQMMKDVLTEVLQILDCNRAWLLYPCDPEAENWSVPVECTQPDYPGAFSTGAIIPMSPEIKQILQDILDANGIIIHDPTTGGVPHANVLDQFSIRSQLMIALHPFIGSPWVFGVHQCSHQRIWTKDEQKLIIDISQRLGDALSSFLIHRNLQDSEARFRLATQASSVGVWDWDIPNDSLSCSEGIAAIFGLESGTLKITYQEFIDLIHPDDRDMVNKKILEALENIGNYDIQYRIIWPDSTIRWIEVRGNVHLDTPNSSKRMVGTVADITQRKVADEALRASEERFRSIFETEPECVIILNPDTTLITINPAGLTMIEADTIDILQGKSILRIVDEEFRDDFIKLTDNVCINGQSGMLKFQITGLKGTTRWFETHAVPIRDSQNVITGLLAVTRDITVQKHAEEALIIKAQNEQMLLRELDHRVRNNLASLITLINMSANSTDNVNTFADSIHSRVYAMAKVHTLLSRGQWRPIALKTIVQQVVVTGYDQRLRIKGPDIVIPPDKVQPLVMILNELTSNCQKYGAFSMPHGELSITWQLNKNSESLYELNLEWQEMGGPTIEQPIISSTGTRLIMGLVKSELQGNIDMQYPESGAHHYLQMLYKYSETDNSKIKNELSNNSVTVN